MKERKVLLHLAPGTKEDTASCTAFFEDLKRRGLPDPLLAVTDGAPGLIRAVETCFPQALRQRCLVHRLRNLRSKAPEAQWPEIAVRARACYEAASPALATLLREDFVHAYARDLPAVVKCFTEDFEACITHLRFPLRHRKVIRTTNLLERLFLEARRRTKIIPHAFGEPRFPEAPEIRSGTSCRSIGAACDLTTSDGCQAESFIGSRSRHSRSLSQNLPTLLYRLESRAKY